MLNSVGTATNARRSSTLGTPGRASPADDPTRPRAPGRTRSRGGAGGPVRPARGGIARVEDPELLDLCPCSRLAARPSSYRFSSVSQRSLVVAGIPGQRLDFLLAFRHVFHALPRSCRWPAGMPLLRSSALQFGVGVGDSPRSRSRIEGQRRHVRLCRRCSRCSRCSLPGVPRSAVRGSRDRRALEHFGIRSVYFLSN
jgi:hypothetical protein